MVCKKVVKVKAHVRMCPGRKPPSTPPKRKRRMIAPRAPGRPKRKKGTTAIFKKFKGKGRLVSKEVAGTNKRLVF